MNLIFVCSPSGECRIVMLPVRKDSKRKNASFYGYKNTKCFSHFFPFECGKVDLEFGDGYFVGIRSGKWHATHAVGRLKEAKPIHATFALVWMEKGVRHQRLTGIVGEWHRTPA